MTDVTAEKIIFSVRQRSLLFTPTVKTVVFSAVGSSNNVSFSAINRKVIFNVAGGAGSLQNINADWNASQGFAEIFNKPSTFPPKQHSHIASDVSGLTTSLNEKVDNSQVLTNVPVGALFTDTLFDDSLLQSEISANTLHAEAPHAPLDAGENVQSDWDAVSGDELILNKPPYQLPVNLTVSSQAPSSPNIGDLWVDTTPPPDAEAAIFDTEETTFDGDPTVTFRDN